MKKSFRCAVFETFQFKKFFLILVLQKNLGKEITTLNFIVYFTQVKASAASSFQETEVSFPKCIEHQIFLDPQLKPLGGAGEGGGVVYH